MGPFVLRLPYGQHRIRFTNDRALPKILDIIVSDTEPAQMEPIRLKPAPARLTLIGVPDGSIVEVAGKRHAINALTHNDPIFINLPEDVGSFEYDVRIKTKYQEYSQRLLFHAGENVTFHFTQKPL